MKKYIETKLIESTFFRVKALPIMKYGYWWFKKIPDIEFNNIVSKLVRIEESVYDNQSLLKFL